jgi:hypothetical protein
VPVIDASGDVINVVSQSAVLASLLANEDKCGALLDQTLDDVSLGTPKAVISVRMDQPVKEAFRHIRDNVRNLAGLVARRFRAKSQASGF